MDIDKVHEYADTIEQEAIRESSASRESTPREVIPTPERIRTEYQYPFSSPDPIPRTTTQRVQ